MKKFSAMFLWVGLMGFPVFGDSLLKATSFPATFEDVDFTDRLEIIKDGYEPFADLSAYDILNIVDTDKNIAEEIAADEAEEEENKYSDTSFENEPLTRLETHSGYTAYCQSRAPHIPQSQTIPFGKPVLDSDYKYCSAYGVRNFGTKEKPRPDNHYGFDIGCTAAQFDRPVFTPANGIVERVKPNSRGSSAGNYILINHQNGFKTYYMHLNTMLVKQGQTVSAGCQIGTIGYTGGAKANKSQFANVEYPTMRKEISHLHYEMHYNGALTSVTDLHGKTVPIVHKFSNSKSIDPAYFMGVK